MSAPTSSYDELPYDDKPIRATHPDHLAALATWHGLAPAPPDRCRVLELGCAAGHNLMALAICLPQAHFTGIDLSPRQIAAGQDIVHSLGLQNVQLQARSLLDVDATLGEFDYIVAHGVYSWVPADVQDKLLSICARNLAPNGVAYVSYNTYPGWHQRGMVREMMQYHVGQFNEPRQRVEQARAFLTFLIEGRAPKAEVTTYHRMLADEANMLREVADSYVFHEHLEEINQPLYFHEFMARAQSHGLQYLEEALPNIPIEAFPAATREILAELAEDRVRLEQYLDFLRDRTFRRTLLCHAAQRVDLAPPATRLTQFRFTTAVWPSGPDVDVVGDSVVEFRGEGVQVSTNTPLVKAALVELCRAWPCSLPFAALQEKTWEQLAGRTQQPLARETLAESLATALERCYSMKLLRLHVWKPPFVLDAGPRPLASPLARYQAGRGELLISNLWHAFVRLDERERSLLVLLDGTRESTTLATELAPLVSADELAAGWLAARLTRLGQLGLLLA